MLYLLYVNSICGAAMKTLIFLLCLISVNAYIASLGFIQHNYAIGLKINF